MHARRSYVSARAVQILTYALVGFLVLLPIVPIVLQSFRATPLYDPGGAWTLSEYVALWHDATFWQAVRTTLIFGLLSTAISLAIGLAAAILVARTTGSQAKRACDRDLVRVARPGCSRVPKLG